VPPVPPTVTFTGIVKVEAPVTVTVYPFPPLMLGVDPECPVMTTMSPLERPCGTVVVIVVGFATEDVEIGTVSASGALA
jgi:hypothetical protein